MRFILMGAIAGALVGCSTSRDNSNNNNTASVNEPYRADVGATNNTVAEPSGVSAPENTR
ncbi:MAG TPA: hypothetical protein VHB20_10900 [Verrucomicrobiae bacterium]|nr:hypothetical protein [Verrucomicrobiae bacterium]